MPSRNGPPYPLAFPPGGPEDPPTAGGARRPPAHRPFPAAGGRRAPLRRPRRGRRGPKAHGGPGPLDAELPRPWRGRRPGAAVPPPPPAAGFLAANAEELLARVRPRDLVLLHDPQTAGLAPHLARAGAIVVWRCHIGADAPSAEAEAGWDFLTPYIRETQGHVFTRLQYIPACCDHGRSGVIPPT